MKSWIRAKNVFQTAMSGERKLPMCVMRSPTTNGCPWALARMLACTKPRPNMKGWNCRAASRIQNSPRTICNTRCEGRASGKRRPEAGPVPDGGTSASFSSESSSTSMAGLGPGYRPGSGDSVQDGSWKSWVMQLVGVAAFATCWPESRLSYTSSVVPFRQV